MGNPTTVQVRTEWAKRVREFLPGEFSRHPTVADCVANAAVLLHGSTTRGIDDAVSDLDVWVLTDDAVLQQVDRTVGTRFFDFKLDGKLGHFNFESGAEFRARVKRCDFTLISELRDAMLLSDHHQFGERLIVEAQKPMRDEVRRTWARYHYVEMRGEHKATRNPIERGDAVAILQALTSTLSHAMQTAMVLDSTPYPYVKWLGYAARQTPTGAAVMRAVDQVLEALGTDVLRVKMPSGTHPITQHLWDIRKILTEECERQGLDEPWLNEWWLHMTAARQGIQQIEW
jgi:hypothetical protein